MGGIFSVFMGFRLQTGRERWVVSGVQGSIGLSEQARKDSGDVIYFTGGISIAAAFADRPIPQHDMRHAQKHVETEDIVC